MLVKEGHKGTYLLCGIIQLILAVLFSALLIPIMLSSLGIDTSVWLETVNKIKTWAGGKYIFGAIDATLVIVFVITLLSIPFKRSGASLFIKLSSAVAMFTFACRGLENFCVGAFGKTTNIMSIFNGGLVYLLLAVSVVLLILGLVFQCTVSRNNENKANFFLISKNIVWIVLLLLNYVIPSILNSSAWLEALFGYNTIALPYFLCWYFLIMGIFELISSPQLINPNDSKYNTGTQPPAAPIGYIPVAPIMVDPFTPVMPNNPALKGRNKQGLASEGEEVQNTEIDESMSQSLAQQSEENNSTFQTQESENSYNQAEPETPQPESQEENEQPQENITPTDGDYITQGLTPPEEFNEIQTLEEVQAQNGTYESDTKIEQNNQESEENNLGEEKNEENTLEETKEVTPTEEPTTEQEVENVEEPSTITEEAPQENVEEASTADEQPLKENQEEIVEVKENIKEEIPTTESINAPAEEIIQPVTEISTPTEEEKVEQKQVVKEVRPMKKASKKATAKSSTKPEEKPKKAQSTKPKAEAKPKIEEPAEKKELTQNEKIQEIDKIIKTLSSPRQTSRTRKTRKDTEE